MRVSEWCLTVCCLGSKIVWGVCYTLTAASSYLEGASAVWIRLSIPSINRNKSSLDCRVVAPATAAPPDDEVVDAERWVVIDVVVAGTAAADCWWW